MYLNKRYQNKASNLHRRRRLLRFNALNLSRCSETEFVLCNNNCYGCTNSARQTFPQQHL